MNTSLSKKHLRYGTVLKINMDKVTDPFSTYMLPIFIKPGRTHFILRTPEDKLVKSRVEKNARVRMMNYHKPEDVCFKFYYNRHIVPMREEKVPGCKYLLHGWLHMSNFVFVTDLQTANWCNLTRHSDSLSCTIQFSKSGAWTQETQSISAWSATLPSGRWTGKSRTQRTSMLSNSSSRTTLPCSKKSGSESLQKAVIHLSWISGCSLRCAKKPIYTTNSWTRA